MKNLSLAFLLVVANVAAAQTTNSEITSALAETNAASAIPTLQIPALLNHDSGIEVELTMHKYATHKKNQPNNQT